MRTLATSCKFFPNLALGGLIALLSTPDAPGQLTATTIGNVWYVDGSASSGGSGTSWSDPFDDLQDAIDAASARSFVGGLMVVRDQIWVREGTYVLTAGITVDKPVKIYGGFDGTESDRDDRDWESNVTVVDGDNSVRCFEVSENSTLDGLVIENGRDTTGAGIYIDSPPSTSSFLNLSLETHVIIRNCTIVNNEASLSGGGIYDLESSPDIENCVFSGNSGLSGGAIFNWESSPDIERCIFAGNSSTGTGTWGGGAILGDYLCYGTITNCLFYENTSASYGGAIAYHMAYPTITNCTFADNEAAYSGGSIYTNTASPTVRNSILWRNSPDEISYPSWSSTYPSVSYSDVQGGYAGTGNTARPPRFVFGAGDYHLAPGSPCIDAGNDSVAPDEDLDEVSRPQDGDLDGTKTCDMGAYEFTR